MRMMLVAQIERFLHTGLEATDQVGVIVVGVTKISDNLFSLLGKGTDEGFSFELTFEILLGRLMPDLVQPVRTSQSHSEPAFQIPTGWPRASQSVPKAFPERF